MFILLLLRFYTGHVCCVRLLVLEKSTSPCLFVYARFFPLVETRTFKRKAAAETNDQLLFRSSQQFRWQSQRMSQSFYPPISKLLCIVIILFLVLFTSVSVCQTFIFDFRLSNFKLVDLSSPRTLSSEYFCTTFPPTRQCSKLPRTDTLRGYVFRRLICQRIMWFPSEKGTTARCCASALVFVCGSHGTESSLASGLLNIMAF